MTRTNRMRDIDRASQCWHLVQGAPCGALATQGIDMCDESGSWRFLTCAKHSAFDIRTAQAMSESGRATLSRVVTLATPEENADAMEAMRRTFPFMADSRFPKEG